MKEGKEIAGVVVDRKAVIELDMGRLEVSVLYTW